MKGSAGLGLRSLVFASLLPGTVLVWVPIALEASAGGRLAIGRWRWLGLPLVVAGVAALLWCIVDFARLGRGTLAPVDPPRFVVRGGLYRFVRNPMYVAVLTTLVGEALLFRSVPIAAWAGIVAVLVDLFVITYEEPKLRQVFGADYDGYQRATPRWIPRRPSGVGRSNPPVD